MTDVVARALGWRDTKRGGNLVLVGAVVSGVLALAMASVLLLAQAYGAWRLAQAQSLFVYLTADADPAVVDTLVSALRAQSAWRDVRVLPPEDVRAELAAFGPLMMDLPLPVVLAVDVAASTTEAKESLTRLVRGYFLAAEVDDASLALAGVARGVRLMQQAGVALMGGMLLLLGGMLVGVVRSGIYMKRDVVKLLIQLGARDRQLLRLLACDVCRGLGLGAVLGVLLAVGVVGVNVWLWPALWPLVGWIVMLGMVGAPLGLMLLVFGVALALAFRDIWRLG